MHYLYSIPAPHLPGRFDPLPPLSCPSEAIVSSSLFLWAYFFSFFFHFFCSLSFLSHTLVFCFPLFSPCYIPRFSSDFLGLFHLRCMPLSLSVFLLLLLFLGDWCLPVTLVP